MNAVLFVSAGLASLIHVLFFALESLWWMNPRVHRGVFRLNEQEATTARLLAYNQGFYNLFLGLGVASGLLLWARGDHPAAVAVLIFGCGSMVGAAVVLLSSKRALWRGSLIQGVPPALGLVALMLAS
jgi:putative membrane protein